jgi:HemY protein
MWRAVRLLLGAAALLALAWWIGGLPGTVTAQAGAYRVETSVPAALLLLVLLAAFLVVLLRVIGGVRRAPSGFGAWRGGRRQRQGELALRRGVVALAAGDAVAARAEAGRARKLLGDAPMAVLLSAEAARLAGDALAARAAFRALTDDKEMAFLGHRGLLRLDSAGDTGAHVEAAERAYPGSAWLRERRMALAARDGNFAGALALARAPAQVAALAAGAAQGAPPELALAFAKQAVRADPALAVGVVALARALNGVGKPKAAKRALLAGWKAAPHPMIAEAFLAGCATPIERAQAAAELAGAKPGDAASELLLAETSLAARLTGEARRHAEAAAAAGDQAAHAMLKALDGGAVAPPVGGRWVCATCASARIDWAPLCPACGGVGTFAWRPGMALA